MASRYRRESETDFDVLCPNRQHATLASPFAPRGDRAPARKPRDQADEILSPETKARLRSRSRLVHLGRDGETSQGFVNLPPFRGSTVLFPDVATLKSRKQRYTYGTHGTPTTEALVRGLDRDRRRGGNRARPDRHGGDRVALMTALGAGDHLLMTDSAYQPARIFCDGTLKRMGVETTYYDPRLGAGDRVAVPPQHQGGVRRVAGLAIARGAGHSGDRRSRARARRLRHRRQHLGDAAVLPAARQRRRSGDRSRHEISLRPFRPAARPGVGQRRLARSGSSASSASWRFPPGPEDVYLALRGLRTMELRLREAERQALALAEWLGARPEVLSVIHPARPDHPDHALWKRDFAGSSGLFSVVLKPVSARPSRRCSTGSNCSASAIPGAASRAWSFPSIARATAPRRAGRRAARRCASRSGSRTSRILKDDLARGFERMKAAS